ncbi:MAG: type II toxin-antitoxin system PemK/MazF family toxin [Limisphaerales bacterium]
MRQVGNEPHPCMVVSNPVRADRRDPVEVIMCSTRRAGRPADVTEFVLDEADGLDWPTLCKCDLIYAVPRHELRNRKGNVSEARQSALVRKIVAAHNWSETLSR